VNDFNDMVAGDDCVARGSRVSYAAFGMPNDRKETHVNGVKDWLVVVAIGPDGHIKRENAALRQVNCAKLFNLFLGK